MTARSVRRLAALTLATAVLGTTAGTAAGVPGTSTLPSTATEEDPAAGKLLLMLDASGSMKEKDPSGGTKMAAAKKALTGVVDSLPDTTQVGLRVYGAKEPGGEPTPRACRDTQLVAPIAPLDKSALRQAIKGFQAKGETPIAYSLEQAIKDVGTDGKRNIVLVSDGEESCVPDPCPAIEKLVGQGIDLQIDTVGFGVGDKARKQLRCLADAGHGTYYDAADADALTTSLTKLSQRALRPYSFAGTPVDGTTDKADAPTLKAGQYLDEIPVSKDGVWFRIERTPGSTTWLTATSRPGFGEMFDTEGVEVELTTEDGQSCDREADSRMDAAFSSASPVVAGVRTDTKKPDSTSTEADPCRDDAVLLANVARVEGAKEAPVELNVIEEPPVTNAADLEEAPSDETAKPDKVEATTPAQPVVGGTSFNDAPTVTPGTYEDVVIPGESLYYKVRLEEGQQAVWTIDVPTADDLSDEETTSLSGTVHAPARKDLMVENLSVGEYELDTEVTLWTPTVRYQNRWHNYADDAGISYTRIGAAGLEGDYTLALHTGTLGSNTEAHPQVPFRIRLAVHGEPTTRPAYESALAGQTSSPSRTTTEAASGDATAATDETGAPGQSAAQDEGRDLWLIVGLGALALVTGAAALALALRNRRSPEHPA